MCALWWGFPRYNIHSPQKILLYITRHTTNVEKWNPHLISKLVYFAYYNDWEQRYVLSSILLPPLCYHQPKWGRFLHGKGTDFSSVEVGFWFVLFSSWWLGFYSGMHPIKPTYVCRNVIFHFWNRHHQPKECRARVGKRSHHQAFRFASKTPQSNTIPLPQNKGEVANSSSRN